MSRLVRVSRGSTEGGRWQLATREPSALLRHCVRSLVGFDEQSVSPTIRRQFPEPFVVLILEFGAPLRVSLGGDERTRAHHAGGFAAGIGDRYAVTEHEGRQQGIQVDLTATGARRLFGLPLSEIADSVVALADLLPVATPMIAERLAASSDWEARLDLVEDLIERRILTARVDTSRVDWAVAQIEACGGSLDVASLARESLGVDIPESAIWRTQTGVHHVDITMPGGLIVHFDSPALARVYNRGWREPSGTGSRAVLSFRVPSREDVDQIHDKLVGLGRRSSQPPFDAFWGGRYAIVEDPDGNHIGIISESDPARRSAPPEL